MYSTKCASLVSNIHTKNVRQAPETFELRSLKVICTVCIEELSYCAQHKSNEREGEYRKMLHYTGYKRIEL